MLGKPLLPLSRVRTPVKSRGTRHTLRIVAKQYVPSDSFGGVSPEKAASKELRRFFTFIAARIVLAQLEGSGRGSLAAYDKQSYDDLMQFLEKERMTDADEWMAKLMRSNSALALRLMDVRLAYATEDFEWENLKRLAVQDLSEGNVRIMRQVLTTSLKASSEQDQNTPGTQA